MPISRVKQGFVVHEVTVSVKRLLPPFETHHSAASHPTGPGAISHLQSRLENHRPFGSPKMGNLPKIMVCKIRQKETQTNRMVPHKYHQTSSNIIIKWNDPKKRSKIQIEFVRLIWPPNNSTDLRLLGVWPGKPPSNSSWGGRMMDNDG